MNFAKLMQEVKEHKEWAKNQQIPGQQLSKIEHCSSTHQSKEPVKEVEVQLCSSSEEYISLMEETYMERYLDQIKDFTFASSMLPLSQQEAQALVSARESWLAGTDTSSSLVSSSADLVELEKRIDQVKSDRGWDFVFVRLSSMSPKDGALENPRFGEMYTAELKSLADEGTLGSNQGSELNQKLHALYRASTWCLAMETGHRACQILIEADRTSNDLKSLAQGKISCDFNLVVREYRHFPVELEFRGFIHKRKLTALTQYNEFCFFPQVKQKQKEIADQIQKEFSKMLQAIPLESFVVDFVLATAQESKTADELARNRRFQLPLNDYKVWIIELNPLAEFAGAGLFDWLKDKPVLLGRKDFEFRCHSKLPDKNLVLANMTPSWKKKMGL